MDFSYYWNCILFMLFLASAFLDTFFEYWFYKHADLRLPYVIMSMKCCICMDLFSTV